MLSLRTDELRQLVFAIIASPFFSILAYFGGNQWRGEPTLSYSISFGETVIKQCVLILIQTCVGFRHPLTEYSLLILYSSFTSLSFCAVNWGS